MTIVRGDSQIAEGNGVTSLDIPKPSGLFNRDILWAALCIGAAGTPIVPDGFEQFVTINQANVVVLYGYIKVITDSPNEPANYNFSGWAAARATGFLVAYSGVDNNAPIDATASTAQSNSGLTLTAPSITTLTNNTKLIGMAGQDSAGGSVTEPVTMSEIFESTGTGKRSAISDEDFSTLGATGTRQWTFDSSLAHACFLGALRQSVSSTDPHSHRMRDGRPSYGYCGSYIPIVR